MGKIHVVEFNEDANVVASGECYICTPFFGMLNSNSGSYDTTVKLWDLRLVFTSRCFL